MEQKRLFESNSKINDYVLSLCRRSLYNLFVRDSTATSRSLERPARIFAHLKSRKMTSCSSSTVDDIFNFVQNSDDDFYKILNCDQSSSNDQILAEYRILALKYHPDKNSGDRNAERKFQILNRAKEILLDSQKRQNYNKWLNSGVAISYQQWLNMNEHAQQSLHWANLKTDNRMLTNSDVSQTEKIDKTQKVWKSNQTSSNNVIRKFRNYQI